MNKLLEEIRKRFTPVNRYCRYHAVEANAEYYLEDSENCVVCYKNVIRVNFRKPWWRFW